MQSLGAKIVHCLSRSERPTVFLAAVLALFTSTANAQPTNPAGPDVYTFHGSDLSLVKQRLAAGDRAVKSAVASLIGKAERRLEEGPYSVVTNGPLPPSKDPHDYLSQAPYWWPDPKRPDGLPFIRRDGKTNPDAQGGDDEPMDDMTEAVWQLSLAWHLTGERAYAEHAARLLRVWFLEDATRMKPRLKFGQYIPGVNTGRPEGIVETRRFLLVLDANGLLADSQVWTAADQRRLKDWFRDYLEWMKESDHGREEADAMNNHGTWYDAQAIAYAAFVGQDDHAEKMLSRARRRRFRFALDEKSRLEHELERTKSLDYCLFNLEAMMQIAVLGDRYKMELWTDKFEEGRGLKKTVQWLSPYVEGTKPWPYKQISEPKSQLMAVLYRRAAVAYDSDRYERISSQRRDTEDDTTSIRLELIYPRRKQP